MRFKWKPRKARQWPCQINRLANEILVEILSHLPLRDVQNVRLTCRQLTAAGNTALQDRLSILYLHPSTRVLRQAVEICAHPVFNLAIKEVIVLGLPPSPDLLWASTMPRWHRSFPKPPRATGTSAAFWQQVEQENDFQTIGLLVKALLRLPNLVRLTYTCEAKQPGFNPPHPMTREVLFSPEDGYIISRRMTGDSRPRTATDDSTSHRPNRGLLSRMPGRGSKSHMTDRGLITPDVDCDLAIPPQTCDLNVLITLLKNCRSLKEVAYESINQGPLIPLDQRTTLAGLQILERVGFLTSITFAFGSHTGFRPLSGPPFHFGWKESCRAILEASRSLRTLNIIIWSETDQGLLPCWTSQDSLVNTVLCGLGTRPLRELTIVTKPVKTDSLPRSVPFFHDTSGSNDPTRPNTLEFFAQRAQSLERLSISNVQFGYPRPFAAEEDFRLALVRPLLTIFQSAPLLSDFSWKVVRQPHTVECMRQPFSACLRRRAVLGRRNSCGVYGPNIEVSHWDALAQELGLEVDPKTQMWDLAKAILPES